MAAAATASAQFSLTTLSYSQGFASLGSSATATLPDGWATTHLLSYNALTFATTQAAGTTGPGAIGESSAGGIYNFGDGVTASATDRALGFLSDSSYTMPRALFFAFTNNTGASITSLTINFDIEKYREGARAFSLYFGTSPDLGSWATHLSASHSFAADGSNAGLSSPLTTAKTLTLTDLDITPGSSFYFRWLYTATTGTNSTNGQGLAIDNLSITAIPEPSTYAAIFGALALAGVGVHRRRQARR